MFILSLLTLAHEETHRSTWLFITWFTKQPFLSQIILQKVQTPVHVDSDKADKFEVQKFCLEIKQKATTLEDVFKDFGKASLYKLIWVLDLLYHVVVKLAVAEGWAFNLLCWDIQKFHVVELNFFQLFSAWFHK